MLVTWGFAHLTPAQTNRILVHLLRMPSHGHYAILQPSLPVASHSHFIDCQGHSQARRTMVAQWFVRILLTRFVFLIVHRKKITGIPVMGSVCCALVVLHKITGLPICVRLTACGVDRSLGFQSDSFDLILRMWTHVSCLRSAQCVYTHTVVWLVVDRPLVHPGSTSDRSWTRPEVDPRSTSTRSVRIDPYRADSLCSLRPAHSASRWTKSSFF